MPPHATTAAAADVLHCCRSPAPIVMLTPSSAATPANTRRTSLARCCRGAIPVRARTGIAPRQHLASDVRRVFAGVATLLGVNIAIGAGLLQQWIVSLVAATIACVGILYLRRARKIVGD